MAKVSVLVSRPKKGLDDNTGGIRYGTVPATFIGFTHYLVALVPPAVDKKLKLSRNRM